MRCSQQILHDATNGWRAARSDFVCNKSPKLRVFCQSSQIYKKIIWTERINYPLLLKITAAIMTSKWIKLIIFNCINRGSKLSNFKGTPWDDINFRFYFCNEVVYPPDHDFIYSEFLDFYKYFLSLYLWNRLKPKQTLCISKHLLKDDWMFLQHWATCWCHRPSVGQTISVAVYPPISCLKDTN